MMINFWKPVDPVQEVLSLPQQGAGWLGLSGCLYLYNTFTFHTVSTVLHTSIYSSWSMHTTNPLIQQVQWGTMHMCVEHAFNGHNHLQACFRARKLQREKPTLM